MTASYDLRFGGVDMSPAAQVGDVEYCVYGLRRGYPVPVVSVASSMIQDGADERIDSHGNRDQSVIVGLKAADSDALAEAESALFLECQKPRNELSWTPPDGYGAETVFDVLWASLEFADADDWDIEELRRCHRVYILTVRALPFGRAAEETLYPALTVGGSPTTVTIADGTSATGWTSPDGAVTAGSGYLTVPAHSPSFQHTQDSFGQRTDRWTWQASLALSATDFSATPYVTLELDVADLSTQFAMGAPTLYADGVACGLLSSVPISSSSVRVTWEVTDSSVTSLRFEGLTATIVPGSSAPSAPNVRLDNLSRSNQPPANSTGRESTRTIAYGGSARAQGSLQIAHATQGLGDVIVYTGPSYSPGLRQFKTSGGSTTTDSDTVSGTRESFTTLTFEVPADILPRGGYVLMGRLRSTSGTVSRAVSWTASTVIGSTVKSSQSDTSDTFSFTSGVGVAGWSIVELGGMVLPTNDVAEGSSAKVRIVVTASSGLEFDQMWLFYLGDDAALTVVSCGPGVAALGSNHNRLWIDTASLERPVPSIWMGTTADRKDSFHAGPSAAAWGVHTFPPGDVFVYLVTTSAQRPEMALRCFDAFHTHARQRAS